MRAATSIPMLIRAVSRFLLFACVTGTPARAEEISARIPGRTSHEGSSLLAVENAPLLAANGWKRAFWVAFDEGDAGSPLGLLGERNADGQWDLKDVRLRGDQTKIDDTEALARRNGFIYLVGSHFGKKKGKLEAVRQFVARFREADVQAASPEVHLEVRQDDFALHRLINDALAASGIELIPRGAGEEKEYIEKTRKSDEPGKDRISKDDRALNIEGATFLASGGLALGLRYPVTKRGEPLIVVLGDAEALFDHRMPKVEAVWVLHVANAPGQLRGIRELESSGGEIQVVTGSIERTSPDSPLLKDHPGADAVTSEHRAFAEPNPTVKAIESRRIRDLAPAGNVEGIAVDGGDWYLFDDPNEIRVRHETARP